MNDDDDRIGGEPLLVIEASAGVAKELEAVLADFEALLKNGDVVGLLAERRVNASIALLALDGLGAYLAGDKTAAADDLAAAAEEIRGRLAESEASSGSTNGV